jgi:hypothetical protein
MKLPGEVKRVIFTRPFNLDGKQIAEGEEMELDQATAYELYTTPRKPTIRFLHGGVFTITRMHDGYHIVEPWYWPGHPNGFSTSDRQVKVKFLTPCPWFLCEVGDKRRLRLSICREQQYRYQNSPPPPTNCAPPLPPPWLEIQEDRPAPKLSDEDLALKEIEEARRKAMQAPSWVHL